MTLNDLQIIFDRALSKAFVLKKLLFAFCVLALCGVLVVFFRGLSVHAGHWLLLSLAFLPVFLCSGIMLSTGVLLIRFYHDEIKKRDARYRDVFFNSWDVVIGASYFSIPIILGYLLLWVLLGVFFLFREIPGVGQFFAVVLAFGPFLINLGSLLLCLLSISMLFFLAPVLAFKGLDRVQVSHALLGRFQKDIFFNILLAVIAIVPLLFVMGILFFAAFLTGSVCYSCDEPVYTVLQWFFIMIPFTALLSPAVVFFFNFAAESHVLIQKQLREP